MKRTTLHLAKQNFKFSSGHFLIFDDQNAEKLHGHNYRVRVDVRASSGADFSKSGYLVDFRKLKDVIKAQLDQWDEHVLLPAKQKDMKIESRGSNYDVNFRERFYSFPQNEVVLLPVTNTSVEQLSRLLAESFYQSFKKYQIEAVGVWVEETPGQGASCWVSSNPK